MIENTSVANSPCPNGSTLCLTCGLCCEGVLHSHAVVKPDEIAQVCALGLTIGTFDDGPGFPLPCPLYQDHRCSIYYTTTRPHVCGAYHCDLLKKFLAGALTREQGAPIIQRARELLAAVLEQLPAGYSLGQLRRDIEQEWDSGRGMFGSAEMRQQNAGLLLAVAQLTRYLQKHFGAGRKRKVARPQP